MIAIILIGLAAGCASALMFASIISGALISLVLFYLAPLPLMVAAMSWGPLAATIGGIVAAAGLGVIFGIPYCIAFAITVALPAWWLGHLALLGRPLPDAVPGDGTASTAPQLEWYPVGRILLWIAGFAALTTIAAMLTLGTDAEAIKDALRRGLLRILGTRDATSSGDVERWATAFAAIAPSAATIIAMMTLTLNLWLAGKITATSGRLHRPWPDLKSAELPPMTLVALSVALAFCFIGGLIAMFAQITTTALMMAYGLTGFAVLHTLTLALKSRVFWLCCTYAVVVTFGWPVLAMIALGLADAIFGLRRRYLSGKPPPLPAA
ncbi:hypothetical protein [Bradyrhizobium murdochi]|uniref:hypothetical protein n=1 Tax=Bradyrhizobium murdochi TaxID=1038859 RepID=UPI0003F81AB8|nr:hypothetical protein [Bradyrhizobium murdochi]